LMAAAHSKSDAAGRGGKGWTVAAASAVICDPGSRANAQAS
jgi:hypothetical protein